MYYSNNLTCNLNTLRERITLISCITNTNGNMVPHPTVGIVATQTRAGIHTLVIGTGFVRGTILVELTFWSTVWW